MKFSVAAITAALALTVSASAIPADVNMDAGNGHTANRETSAAIAKAEEKLSLMACDHACYTDCTINFCQTESSVGNLSCRIACLDVCGCA
ncbi:hypothetical protein CSOJ01_12003 [Colletotrichum sojae]|uniref:Uncharacterized protein n=1 Tax=Colletotrichum sojae TaxID=2175907 RepID=A0A8H6MM56_9PEZI|nr:hypothetical protein CSOJ01_12003 [Colletotrichum sojae]